MSSSRGVPTVDPRQSYGGCPKRSAQAAAIADLPVAEFMQHVSRLGIPVIRGTAKQAVSDADVIDSWRSDSS